MKIIAAILFLLASVSFAGVRPANPDNLKDVLSAAQPGDVVELVDGSYGPVTISVSGVTIRPIAGAHPVFRGGTNTIYFPIADKAADDPHDITIENVEITGSFYYGVKADSWWDYQNLAESHGARGIVLRGCTIHDTGYDCVKLTPGTNHITLEGCELYKSGHGTEGIDAVNCDDLTVRGCRIHDVGGNGIYAKGGSQRTLIEGCEVWGCGLSGIILGQSADYDWFNYDLNPGVYENIDGVARFNYVHDCKGAGIASWAALRPTISSNYIENVAQTMFSGLLIQGQENWPPTGYVVVPSRDVTMENNVVIVQSNRPHLNIRNWDSDPSKPGLAGKLVLKNNHYEGKPALIQSDVPGYAYSGGLTGWQKLGFDSESTDGGSWPRPTTEPTTKPSITVTEGDIHWKMVVDPSSNTWKLQIGDSVAGEGSTK